MFHPWNVNVLERPENNAKQRRMGGWGVGEGATELNFEGLEMQK